MSVSLHSFPADVSYSFLVMRTQLMCAFHDKGIAVDISVAVTFREWSIQFGAWVETRFRRINGVEYEFVRVSFERPSDRVFLWVYRDGAHVREFVSGQR